MAHFLYHKFEIKLLANSEKEAQLDIRELGEKLDKYSNLYHTMNYMSRVASISHNLILRMNGNSLNPMTLWRFSKANLQGFVYPEIDNVFQIYYDLIDACKDNPEWKKKIEVELGRQLANLYFRSCICGDYNILKSLKFIKRFVNINSMKKEPDTSNNLNQQILKLLHLF